MLPLSPTATLEHPVKPLRILSLLLAFFLLGACSSDTIERTRNGFLIDSATPIGKAFESYPYFSSLKWAEVAAPDGKRLIEVTGTYNLEKVRSSTPTFVSAQQEETFRRELETAARAPSAAIDARYVARFAQDEKRDGNIFRLQSAGFVFTSPDPRITEAVALLAPQIDQMAPSGLHEIYSGNTATVLLLLGTVEITASSLAKKDAPRS